jgi:hypothetical protein
MKNQQMSLFQFYSYIDGSLHVSGPQAHPHENSHSCSHNHWFSVCTVRAACSVCCVTYIACGPNGTQAHPQENLHSCSHNHWFSVCTVRAAFWFFISYVKKIYLLGKNGGGGGNFLLSWYSRTPLMWILIWMASHLDFFFGGGGRNTLLWQFEVQLLPFTVCTCV